jgi:hypothetical protein
MSSVKEDWTPSWAISMIGAVLFPLLAAQRNIHQTYTQAWLADPIAGPNFDIIVLTPDAGMSYLHTPFETRPLSVWLPNIRDHRQSQPCKPPFPEDEKKTGDYVYPRWVAMKTKPPKLPNELNSGSYKQWREDCKKLAVRNFNVNTTKVYVGCSFCGRGSEVKLHPNAQLKRLCGHFYVAISHESSPP